MTKRAALARLIDHHGKFADELMGLKAKLVRRTFGELDVITGEQAYTDQSTDIMVRSWPLSVRERVDLASAGLQQIDARWTLRVASAPVVNTDDLLKVGNFYYEVIPGGLTKDEFDVEWTILTRRRVSNG